MSWMRVPERPRTLALKLALFYAFFFTLVAVGSMAVLYNLVRTHTLNEIDTDLLKRRDEIGLALRQLNMQDLNTEFHADTEAYGRRDYFIRLLDSRGRPKASSDTGAWPGIGVSPEVLAGLAQGESSFRDLPLADQRKKARLLLTKLGPNSYVQIGASLEDSENFLRLFEHYAVLILGSMILLGSLIGWWLARKAMAGVEAVTRTAADIAGGQLDRRVEAAGHGREIDELVSTFNRMADRVQQVMAQMRQINDNIAHDLRSPLARIRGMAEAGVVSGRLDAEATELAGGVVEECDRLLQMINTMLDISETEAGVQALNLSRVDVAAQATGLLELFRDMAAEKGIRIETQLAPLQPILADPRKLQRLLANLLDNAVKYTPPGGRVRFELEQDASETRLRVADTGPGIPAADLPHIFERFYRADRSRHAPGNGLGLSLARAIARAHGGDIRVSTAEGGGSCFTACLPRAG
jgi:heavy metal sensor kinase